MKKVVSVIIIAVVVFFGISLIGENSRAEFNSSGIVNKISYRIAGDGRYDTPDSTIGNFKLGLTEVKEDAENVISEIFG